MTPTNILGSVRLTVVMAVGLATTSFAADLSSFPASTKTGVTYAKDIQPIFKQYCFKCHGDGPQYRANLRLDSVEGVVKGGKDGKVIVPGKSEESDLVLDVARVGEKPMPPKPRAPRANAGGATNATPPPAPAEVKLTAEEVGLIRAWIDQGAN